MGHHTFDADGAERLEDESRYAYLSVDELLAALDPGPDDRVGDLGSGTGFYTRAIAPQVGRILALDLQPTMHAAFEEFGVPVTVDRVTATIDAMPVRMDALAGAYSTMTYHEFASDEALMELTRVVEPGGRIVIADWSASGAGDRGPPLSERYDAETVARHFEDHGFDLERVADRRETLVVVARNPAEPTRQS
ncbi:class I SAM-dependent methyltransferase [Halorhabdus amylolytica]|uniref:class I SAM-dependent methyltransferase n=1 Tax=Halorhabdus amylolytica TaxID=2559573 RepID=UPI0010AB05E4|nr:methyltransferase domain-containing protein [Halorhabdus amylolytica]